MSRRLLVVALVAGVTAAAKVPTAGAQPVTRPSDATESTPAPASRSTTESEPSSTTTTSSKAKAKAAKAKAAKTKAAKAKSAKAKKAKAAKLAKAKRARRKRAQLARAKSSRSKGSARVGSSDIRSKHRADNMPRGFVWPPSPEMVETSRACEVELDTLGVTWQAASPEGKIVNPIVIPSMIIGGLLYTSVYRKGPHKIDCQFVRTLATIGPELHALGVREINFGSIYRNTKVRVGGVRKNILSRHALGIAMDVVSVVDQDGRVAVVETDYPTGDPLLLAIEDAINKTGKFRIVLTPRNDPISHDDHFHIEAVADYTRDGLH